MDIFTFIKKDHRKVTALFKQIISAKSIIARGKLFQEVRQELFVHMDAEHLTFYKALEKSKPGQKDVKHGDKEHVEIKKTLKRLVKIPQKSNSQWLVQFGELKHLVDHHVKDEETRMFSDGKKIISKDEAALLTEEMKALKVKLKNSKRFLKLFPLKGKK